MSDISGDALVPSGEFTPTSFSGLLTVASGASGTVLTIPAPASGKKIRLYSLTANGEAGITVNANGAAVVTALTLSTPVSNTAGHFSVGTSASSTSGQGAGVIPYIDSRVAITVLKASGSTASTIYYSYAEGY